MRLITKQNELGTLRKRGVIAWEVAKDGVYQQNKKCLQGTVVNSEISSYEDQQNKVTRHVIQKAM